MKGIQQRVSQKIRPVVLRGSRYLAILLLFQAALPSLEAQFGASTHIFPHFVANGGSTTFFDIHNPGTQQITVTVDLFNSDSSLLESRSQVVAAGGSAGLAFGEAEGTLTTGWARLTAGERFTASEFFQLGTGGELFSQVGVLSSRPATKIKFFGVFLPSTATRTGFAIANPSATESSNVTVRLFERDGSERDSKTITLGPGQQTAQFLEDPPFFVGLQDFEGVVEITADVPVTAVTLRSDGNLFATVSVNEPGLPIRAEFPEGGTPNLIGGFEDNSVTDGVEGATIGGGGDINTLNTVMGNFGTVGGGISNTASGGSSTVSGGSSNTTSGNLSTVGGGLGNTAGEGSTVGGGSTNTASGDLSTVGGGIGNTASGGNSTVGGGSGNTASGSFSTVPGGRDNEAQGDYSFAGGRRAKALCNGCFVWADDSDFDFISDTGFFAFDKRFLVRATGGVQFTTGIDGDGQTTAGVAVFTGGGSWSSLSAREAKENFSPTNGRQVLERLVGVPITTWNYKAQDREIRHIGPIAQDFSAAFEVGADDRHITTVDADGVALAAIQGLYQMLADKQEQIDRLAEQNTQLAERLVTLEQRID